MATIVRKERIMIRLSAALVCLVVALLVPAPASAHCDTTKGPVVTSARAALDAKDPKLVLHWVRPEDEDAVKAVFQHTLEVRSLGPQAKALAEQYFFETLVRIHRAGEGAPYTGLTDNEPEPLIKATDRALELGTADELERQLVAGVRSGLSERFAAAKQAKASAAVGDVAAGRTFVAAYVPLTHWVEGVHVAAAGAGEHHAGPGAQAVSGAAAHDSATHARPGTVGEAPFHHAPEHLPWILAVMFAIIALAEGAVLAFRWRRAAA